MEQQLYQLCLLLTGIVNLLMAVSILFNGIYYRYYSIYRRSRLMTALSLTAFGIGFLLHHYYGWRFFWEEAATALSVSYFHIGGTLLSWSHTSLLNPHYMSRFVIARDITAVLLCLAIVWSGALMHSAMTVNVGIAVFIVHVCVMSYAFFHTYYRVSHRLMEMELGNIREFVRWMLLSCYLIIGFGLGSIIFTAFFPTDIWPYTLLLCIGMFVFIYIFYSISEYGVVIEAATNATEDVAKTFYHLLAIVIIGSSFTFISCSEQSVRNQKETEADSLINDAYNYRDYDRIISLADMHEHSGSLSKGKAYYWRGYAYSRMRKIRLAEMEWKKAISLEVKNQEDLTYYAMSANRLAALLYTKFDYEGTIRVAVPAIKLLQEHEFTINTDYANLHTFFGNCQLRLGHQLDAANSYMIAWQIYLQVTESSEEIANFTSSIIGIVSITDAYIKTEHYQEALDWTDRFDSMLSRYRSHPQADDTFIDKQFARLYFYRGCALEGLNRKKEALEAYKTAITTQYAKTADGQIEATNYLITAGLWTEAAEKFEVLEKQLRRYDIQMSLDNISTYLLPKYKANLGANRMDSAVAVSQWICHSLDTAITIERNNAAAELAAIYDTQQKEKEIVEQRASLSHQRFVSTFIILVLVILGFGLFIYLRHQSARRLETAYHHLERANARAEESSRMKSNFIQQISHEIRTPLNILSGFTQIITSPDMALDEATRTDINKQILENTNRITGLVNKMLELSEANSKSIIEKNDDSNVIQIAVEAADASGITTAQHLQFDLQMAPETESMVIKTNHRSAVRALSLLLDNARKFTAPAEARKSNATDATKKNATLYISADEQQLTFTIEDTGIGIPAKDSERVFQEFVQLDEYYDGTGIGLTVARSLARRLGGDITLDTSYTSGARFVFTLPIT